MTPKFGRLEKWRPCSRGGLGAPVSPLLSNVYLPYVFDLWVQQWRRRQPRGDMVVIRYADDTVLGFEHRFEAKQFLDDLKGRVQEFGIELQPEKTRLIAFVRFANRWNQKRGRRKAEIFNFHGFIHIYSTSRAPAGLSSALQRLRSECMRS
ncbi:reverse transcriptase domain-containing protein [Noviherbaspirillum soli]|uniref:reverse transcriptase domain-containing protein n=1 Tax=Noviherbaspirillum soli TaxID=1064518 RepID=UPI00188D0F99|nr:reverse transcriptase domain-containing protein [Noviherbaspirillum soli]